jgi:hypothetical protein
VAADENQMAGLYHGKVGRSWGGHRWELDIEGLQALVDGHGVFFKVQRKAHSLERMDSCAFAARLNKLA